MSSDQNQKIILVIEDNLYTLTAYQSVFTKAGYQVYAAESGFKALELLREIPTPNVIILDRFMPGMNGEEFLVELANLQLKTSSRIPILGVSSLPRSTSLIQRFSSHVTEYLERPC